jgi:hypothetical protein
MRAKERLNRNLMLIAEILLELVSVFNDASRNFISFSWSRLQAKSLKPISQFTSTDLASKQIFIW